MIINPAYAINLKPRPARLPHITSECHRHNLRLHRIEAVNGREIYPDEPKKRPGIFGCYNSHLKLLKILQGVRGDYFLIVEDDCVFEDDFRYKLLEYYQQLPPTWDMLYLGGNTDSEGATEDFSYNLCRARNVYCTHAYIIKKESIQGLIEVVESRMWKIDVLYCEYQKSHSCFITEPKLAWQKEGFSGVETQNT